MKESGIKESDKNQPMFVCSNPISEFKLAICLIYLMVDKKNSLLILNNQSHNSEKNDIFLPTAVKT